MSNKDRHALNLVLANLDPENDDHWTSDGLPRVEVVGAALQRKVTRREITECAPGLTREAALERAALADFEGEDDHGEDEPSGPDVEIDDESDDESDDLDEDDWDVEDEEIAGEASTEDEDDASTEDEDSSASGETAPKMTDEEIEDAMLDLPWPEIANNEERLLLAIRALDRKAVALRKEIEQKKIELAALYNKSEICSRQMTRIQKAKPGADTADIRAYLRQQQKNREEEQKRLDSALIGLSTKHRRSLGIGGSQIDRVMRARGKQRGGGRPMVPPKFQ